MTLPCDYNKKTPCLGVIWGLILSLLNTLPWLIKIIVTIYDFFYVVGLGLLSWGYYEANSMKYRSRPIRTFPQSQIVPYNFLEAKGNDIMRQNQIRERENEEISFVDNIEIGE